MHLHKDGAIVSNLVLIYESLAQQLTKSCEWFWVESERRKRFFNDAEAETCSVLFELICLEL